MDGPAASDSTHDLLLAMAGRVDDDMLGWARELVAVGEDARAVELLTASLLADRAGLPEPVHAALVTAGRAARIDLDAAVLPVAGSDDFTAHLFDPAPGAVPDVAAAVRGLPARQLRDCRVLITWRLTPAGSAPGPLPHPVVLIEVFGGGPPSDVLAYQVAVALERAGAQASVEVLTAGHPMSAYHAAALRDAVPARFERSAAATEPVDGLVSAFPAEDPGDDIAATDRREPPGLDDRYRPEEPEAAFPPGNDPLGDPMSVVGRSRDGYAAAEPYEPAAAEPYEPAGYAPPEESTAEHRDAQRYDPQQYDPQRYVEEYPEPAEPARSAAAAPPRPAPAQRPVPSDDDPAGTSAPTFPAPVRREKGGADRPQATAPMPAATRQTVHEPPLRPPVQIRAVPDPGGRRRKPADEPDVDPAPRPAPRPAPGRSGTGRRPSLSPIPRTTAPTPITLVRGDGTTPAARSLQPVPTDPPSPPTDEQPQTPTLARPDDPLNGPLDQPLMAPLLEPTSLELDPLGDRWSHEWSSGSWAMDPSALDQQPPAQEPAAAPEAEAGSAGRRRARHRSGDEVAEPDAPADDVHHGAPPARPTPVSRQPEHLPEPDQQPDPPALGLRPESLARLSDADRELLARLQVELGQGRKPRVTRRAGIGGQQPTNGSAPTNGTTNGSAPTNGHSSGPPDLAG